MKRKVLIIGFAVVALMLSLLVPLPGSTAQAEAARPLYAGTSNPGVVYKYNGTTWTAISGSLGFAVLDIIEFQGDLYAATMSNYPTSGVGKVWRYEGSSSWTVVASLDDQVADLEVWNGDLYAGTAWNGGKLYRYNATTDTFDYIGTVPDRDSGGNYHRWSGIRAMYPWSQTGHLHLGDIGYDVLGRYDGTNLIHDAYMGGSCIYDFAEFNGKLYAGAWAGRLLWSSTGVGRSWSYTYPHGGEHIWELEVFQGYLYTGDYAGDLMRLDASHSPQLVWSSGSSVQQITSMVADGDDMLYFGTGGEAGYNQLSYGTARVYAYDGSNPPVEIFNADGVDTGGTDHAGVQTLYLSPNQPPVADPNGPYLGAAGSAIAFEGTGSSDPDGDPLTYNWDFGDSNIGSGATPNHTYTEAGIYNVCLTVTDTGGLSDTACTIVVIYDPDAGFVTGGGWIDSPAGAYKPDDTLAGKANFGFVSKYKKGANTPTGNTEFQFHAGDLNFHSSSYQWLVVTRHGTFAQFKGSGTINGMGDYKFILWAGDDDPDTFRIKIWEEDDDGNETVTYDNGFDQAIGGGSIVIHTKK